jgi:hypothetical protein
MGMTMTKAERRRWRFMARFRRHAFGWRSQPAIARVIEALAEIGGVAREDPVLASEGAVLFLERVSAALEHVDSSSGAIGSAVNRAVAELASIVARAPVDSVTRAAWLERLFDAHQADEIPYIESLADRWGELCASKETASAWAERLIGITRMALSPDKSLRGHFHGTAMCLSALFRAERFDEIIELVSVDTIWPYKEWAVRALAAKGEIAQALRYAESCRSPWASDFAVDSICEEVLLSAGRAEEAYTYGLRANQRATYLATFRAVRKKYSRKASKEILADLAATTPGQEGKWFAAAKDVGLYAEALELASRSPCDPRTLTRAARDYKEKEPAFAVGSGELAIRWLALGYGHEITSADVLEAYRCTLAAAERRAGGAAEVKERIRGLLCSQPGSNSMAASVLARVVEDEDDLRALPGDSRPDRSSRR